ncbi:flavoredoxin [Clostridium perfringens C str. JGS1495]|nr:flavoredoxin [Clostridium perfringens C str. JGS1495]
MELVVGILRTLHNSKINIENKFSKLQYQIELVLNYDLRTN